MSSLFLFWLLLSIPPLLAKSVGQVTITGYKEGGLEVEKGRVLTRLEADEANVNPSSVPSLSEWFLQIAHKNCLGPEGQPGTCMFNFECQQEHGQVVGACLDGFLFGACCYLATDYSTESVPALSTTQDSLEASLVKNISAMATSLKDNLSHSLVYSRNTHGNSSNLLEPNEPNMGFQIPNALILRNGSEQEINNQPAAQSPVGALPFFHTSSVGKKGEEHSESTLRVISSSATASVSGMANSVPDTWNAGIHLPLSTISDNQISSLLTKIDQMPATADYVIVNKGDPILQTQLTTLLNANLSSSSILQQELESSTFANRIPVRNKGKPTKRPRPKPTFTSTTPTSTSTSARQDNESSTTSKPQSLNNTTDLVVTESTESVVDQQASVLQFLVSNSPIWVLEELINGSALTTWYPLPIPDEIPESLKTQVPVDPVGLSLSSPIDSSTLVTPRPFKTKPIKSRPDISNRTSSTTAPIANKTEGQSIAINLTMAAIAATNVGITVGTTSSTTTTKKPRPFYDYAKDCGVRPMVPEARIVGGKRSDYGRWPWQVLIRESTWFGIFSKNKCGGVLISDRHVLTAAHCQPGFLGSLLVILGEFELAGHAEPFTPVEKHVKRVVVHRDYVERTFENDMAILELDSPVEFKPYIVPICLPSISEGDFIGKKAEVTGWGKLSHNGLTPGVLYEVDVPIISNPECHDMFKKAGHEKRILDSFVCAGYSEGKKDSCEGDSGGPLMVEGEDGRWLLVGTVSHGIRCAYPNMPGVYMRMTYYRPWIERVIGVGGIH